MVAFGDGNRSFLLFNQLVRLSIVRCRYGSLQLLWHHHALDRISLGGPTVLSIHDKAQVLLGEVYEHGLIGRLGELVLVLASIQSALEDSVTRLVVDLVDFWKQGL